MIILLDSYYREDICNTSLVVMGDSRSSNVVFTDTVYTRVTADYIPGQFYKRELPGIINILEKLKREHPDIWELSIVVVVDGFNTLRNKNEEWPGLGGHLKEYLESINERKVVWGIAKSKFMESDKISELVYRGNSKNPLYVQSTGSSKIAAKAVKTMPGDFRIPDMLKEVDKLSRIF